MRRIRALPAAPRSLYAAVAVCLLAWGCRWPVDLPQPYTSDVAHPTEEDELRPPHARALACTPQGFTLVVGPELGCAELEGIFGRGEPDGSFSFPSSTEARAGTPLRVIRRGAGVVDVEVVIRCRPFYNDASSAELIAYGFACQEMSQGLASCRSGRFDAVLQGESALELSLVGEGAEVDVRACVRPAP